MSQCPHGHESASDAKFCTVCGAAMVATCVNGHVLPPGARFCRTCGVAIPATSTLAASRGSTLPRSPSRSTSRRATSRRTPLLVTAAVIVVLGAAVGLFVWLRAPGSTPVAVATTSTAPSTSTTAPSAASTASAASATDQAAALTTLLEASGHDRALLQRSIDTVQLAVNAGRCPANLVTVAAAIARVATGREDLLNQLSTASFSALPSGALIEHDLRRAWDLSERIDVDFATWASTEVGDNCTAGDTSIASYQATTVLDPQSTAIKNAFVALWNPIASTFAQPSSWTAAEI